MVEIAFNFEVRIVHAIRDVLAILEASIGEGGDADHIYDIGGPDILTYEPRLVPRTRLPEVLERVCAICDRHGLRLSNVFHAGDGNLHPLLAYDSSEPGVTERIHTAGREIVEASLAAGGVLSGEHGIGVEKRDFMALQFSGVDLDHQNRMRSAFDPFCRLNPGKVLPSVHTCADIGALERATGGVWG